MNMYVPDPNGRPAGRDIQRLVKRLARIIYEENAAIKSSPAADVAAFVEAKNRCLYELELAMRAGSDALDDPDTRQAVRELYTALAMNQTLLGAQVKAVGEAIELIEDMAGVGKGDGTYTNPARKKPAAYL